eukprot:tig00000605_g2470.t1
MRRLVFAAVLAAVICAAVAAAPVQSRPRGVSKADAAAYSSSDGKFTCLDKSKTIAFERVNDDYCDCADGSDEPGTSACSPKGRFWCVNRGHEGHFIPSSRVDDGICDCCDGSDEWRSGSCPQACLEKGAEARKKAADAARLFAEGAEVKARWSEEGRRAVAEAEEKMIDLRLRLEAQKGIVATIEAKKKEAEDLQNKEREVQRKADEERRQAEEAKRAAEATPAPAETTAPPPPAAAEGAAPEAAAEAAAAATPEPTPPLPEVKELHEYPTQHDQGPGGDEGEGEPEEEEEPEEASHAEAAPSASPDPELEYERRRRPRLKGFLGALQTVAELPERLFLWLRAKITRATPPKLFPSAVEKLKGELDAASDEKRRMEEDMSRLEKLTTTDFGPEKEFHGINGQCFSLKTPEYTYEICPFDKASQKIGYSDTVNLGKWSKWSNGYKRMEFREGQQCWNGPKREADVDLVCGAKNELKSVSEPNKCVYLFVFETPAACSKAEAEAALAAAAAPPVDHDEL